MEDKVRTGRSQRRSRRHQSFEYKLLEGERRNEHWSKLTTAEKIANLDRRLGKGIGAAKQRKQLEATA